MDGMAEADELWLDSELPLTIGPKEIHVCKIDLTGNEPQLTRLWETLSSDERARADRFYFSDDRRRFIVAHGSLRRLLAGYLGVSPSEVSFIIGEYGKPCLSMKESPLALHFNLSHSGEIGLIACTLKAPLGVDVERIRPVDHLEQLARQVFTPDEYADWRSVPEQSLEVFFAGWTRKEAIIKAVGKGLSLPLHSFHVSLLPGQPVQVLGSEGCAAMEMQWSLFDLHPEPGYAAAVAIQDVGMRLQRFSNNV
jgi:4'-phosphopantetheinyl transferase